MIVLHDFLIERFQSSAQKRICSKFFDHPMGDYQYQENLNSDDSTIFDKWILYKLDSVVNDFKKYTTTYRFDLMANSIYDFVWNEYCDWYLEIAKNKMDDTTKNYLIFSITRIIKLCHPIVPFITEEIWKEFYEKSYVDDKLLINSSFPSQIRISKEYDVELRVDNIKNIIKKIRKTRTELGIHPKESIEVNIFITSDGIIEDIKNYMHIIEEMSGIKMSIIDNPSQASEYIDLIDDKYVIFMKIKNMINIHEEVNRINKKILELRIIVNKIESKLSNKNFIEKAPSEIINQNISNKTKIENDILSLNNLRDTLSN